MADNAKQDEVKKNEAKQDKKEETKIETKAPQNNNIEIQKLIGLSLVVLNVNAGQMEVLDVDKSTANERVLKKINCVNMMIGVKISDEVVFPLFVLQRGTDSTYINIVRV